MTSTNKNKAFFAFLTLLIGLNYCKAQTVNYKITDTDPSKFRNLNIRPYFSFFIPPTSQVDGLPANLNIDAQYWFPKLLDVRAGICLGTFMGLTGGATYHLKDRVKIKKNKFVTSRTTSGRTETTKFFKAPASSKVIFGPSFDFALGKMGAAGFFTEFDFGLNWQTYTRAYATLSDGSTIKSSKNGWIDVKLQAVVRSVNWGSLIIGEVPYRVMGVGGQINLSGSVRPWKGVTLYFGLPMGVVKMMGVKQNGISAESTIQPILSINLGASINIL